ncbi:MULTISPECIES: hypothetical protein [Hyphobacterium]|uniref:Transglycosylase SLT domain-containing protein n=1 Tax=Hyphobacterium vulgare TaxID=1736751 RepID=A0ABV6ZU51_9PROT
MTTIAPASDRPETLIARAAQATGADFDFLVRTAERESGFDARAQARTSSAAGMFQFLEQTWLGMMHTRGAAHGFAGEANAIERGSDGRYTVRDPARRQEILDMRFDAQTSALMAGELAAANAEVLRTRIGREPTSGELYAAHFLGASGAAELIQTARAEPDTPAAQLFPAAAAANRPIFYADGQARSARDVLANITRLPGGERATPHPIDDQPLPEGRSWTIRDSEVRSGGIGGGFGAAQSFAAIPRGAVLSPAVVEILASLDAPRGASRA